MSAQHTPTSAITNIADAIWMSAQLYADEHAASLDERRSFSGIEGAKRRKLAHEVQLRQSINELAALALAKATGSQS